MRSLPSSIQFVKIGRLDSILPSRTAWRGELKGADLRVSTPGMLTVEEWCDAIFAHFEKNALRARSWRELRVRFICLHGASADDHHDQVNCPCRGAIYKPEALPRPVLGLINRAPTWTDSNDAKLGNAPGG